ncbi:hypothetical protein BJV77DRAFT_968272 [Russula vinacea]|nr:hypothetical protein BJV77DRAFT_968272 [Russula vinacea]
MAVYSNCTKGLSYAPEVIRIRLSILSLRMHGPQLLFNHPPSPSPPSVNSQDGPGFGGIFVREDITHGLSLGMRLARGTAPDFIAEESLMARPAIECVELAPYKLFKSYFCQNGHPMATLLGGAHQSIPFQNSLAWMHILDDSLLISIGRPSLMEAMAMVLQLGESVLRWRWWKMARTGCIACTVQ